MKLFQPIACRESRDVIFLEGVTFREREPGPDRRRTVRLPPDTLGNVKILEDREEGQAIDFREVDQRTGIEDCG